MGITRDADFPAEAAQLMEAMNKLCEGHAVEIVEMAAAQMFAATLHTGAKMRDLTADQFEARTVNILARLYNVALLNWDRKAEPGDVPVGPN